VGLGSAPWHGQGVWVARAVLGVLHARAPKTWGQLGVPLLAGWVYALPGTSGCIVLDKISQPCASWTGSGVYTANWLR
jgi:hypothetical protein